MDWFRYHVNTLDKHKIQSLPPLAFKEWVNLLCVARKYDGVLPDVEQVAWCLHTSSVRAAGIVERAIANKLFDRDTDGTVRPHDWDEWQRSSDDAATRKREQRERDKLRGASRDVSRDKSQVCPVLDTDTETEQRQTRADKPPRGATPITAAEWPLSTEAVCGEFTATDTPLMHAIIHAAAQACAQHDLALTDEILAQAIGEARKQTPKQHNAVLYRTTVPAVLRNWAVEAARRR